MGYHLPWNGSRRRGFGERRWLGVLLILLSVNNVESRATRVGLQQPSSVSLRSAVSREKLRLANPHNSAHSKSRGSRQVAAKVDMISQRAYDKWAAAEKAKGIKQYEKLKKKMISDTVLVGGLIPLYFLVNGLSLIDVITSAAGSTASLLYLLALMRDVDRVTANDPTPVLDMKDATGPLRIPLRILAGYAYAFRPRLAIPIALAMGMAVLDARGFPIPLSARGTAAAAFLSYNVALFGTVFDSLVNDGTKSAITVASEPRVKDL